jgi:hypothetical protein
MRRPSRGCRAGRTRSRSYLCAGEEVRDDALHSRLHPVAGSDVRGVDVDHGRLARVIERDLLLDPCQHVVARPDLRLPTEVMVERYLDHSACLQDLDRLYRRLHPDLLVQLGEVTASEPTHVGEPSARIALIVYEQPHHRSGLQRGPDLRERDR